MSTVRIALDLDGCLSNFNVAFRRRLSEVTSLPDPFPDDWHPELWDWPCTMGYTVKDTVDAWDRIKVDGEFWANLPAYPGAHKFLDWLWRSVSVANWSQGGSHEVYFLTDRQGLRAKDQTEQWLQRHGFGGKSPTVLMTRQGKGRILADLQITHFLDDRPENIASSLENAPRTTPFLLVRPWNRDRIYPHEVQQISDLKYFQRILSSEF